MSSKYSRSFEVGLAPIDSAPFRAAFLLLAGLLLWSLVARGAGLIALFLALLVPSTVISSGRLPLRRLRYAENGWQVLCAGRWLAVVPLSQTTTLGRCVFLVVALQRDGVQSQRCLPLNVPWRRLTPDGVRRLRVQLRLDGHL